MSESYIEQIHEQVDLVSYVGRYVDLKQEGNEWTGRCPFHDDSNPSLSVNQEKRLWHCHGCGAGGDVIEFCMMILDLPFLDAVRRLCAEGGVDFPSSQEDGASWLGVTVSQLAQAKGFSEEELHNYGVADDSYMGRPAVRFSYVDASGQEIWFRHRIALIGDRFRNPKGVKVTAYGFNWLTIARERGHVILVEGETDAITLWMHGVPCIGIPGASNTGCLSDVILDGIDRIYVAKEPDAGGDVFVNGVSKVLSETREQQTLYVMHLKPDAKDMNALYMADRAGFAEALEALMAQAVPQPVTLAHSDSFRLTAKELIAMEFPKSTWVVPGLIPTGLAILAGKPKVGKSWLCMDLGVALSLGDAVLGDLPVVHGRVLYLALEDNCRRLKQRLSMVLGGRIPNDDLVIATTWTRLDEGGLEELEACLDSDDYDTIIIDTLARVWGGKHAKRVYAYDDDYRSLVGLQRLALDREKSIIAVHHLRKAESDDPLDLVSGTTGITGCADTILVLKSQGSSLDADLHIAGRDVEQHELALLFDQETGQWLQQGSPEYARMAKGRRDVIDLLREQPGLGPDEIARQLGEKPGNVRVTLSRMVASGQVIRTERGEYSAANLLDWTSCNISNNCN